MTLHFFDHICKLYENCHQDSIVVNRCVAQKVESRGKINELIVTNFQSQKCNKSWIINILESYLSDDIEKSDIPASIKNKLNTDSPTKSDLNNLQYACVKLELIAGLDSLKKDADLRGSIQLEMLTNKFNKSSNDLDTLEGLIAHFLNNLSKKPVAAEKNLWKRISASIEKLLS